MKETTGAVSSLYIIMFFILIMFGFVVSALSYYKSYKVNNAITSIIEDYGGYNDESIKAINKKLDSYGYNRNSNITCRKDNDNDLEKLYENGKIVDKNKVTTKGYCVSIVSESEDNIYKYYSYKISTYLILDFGIFDLKMPYKMTTKSYTMYNWDNNLI